jgi:archaellum component FlaC
VANLIVSAVSTFDNKGLKKGQKEISAFDKTVKNLGKTFLGVFGAQKLLAYSKNAVNAFAADEKAAKALEVQLKNTGFAFSAPGVELYISNLQKATGVLDDELRPALQTLLTASGSLTQSQRALAVALDVSAATGKSVVEVSAAMAKGFSGQTTALTRLGAGLSKATLASGDMNMILDELSMKFSGQALARLDTYAGKMDQFKVASANASETIGQGILTALSTMGKDKNIEAATGAMESFATSISNVIIGLGVMLGKLTSIAQNSGFLKLLAFSIEYSPAGLIAKLGAKSANDLNAPKSNFTYSLGSGAATEIAAQKEAAAIKAAAKARAEELRLLKQKNAIENKNVEELKKKFDLERIGLTAALNDATSEETKLRLRAQLAILDNNEVLAKKYLAEMEAAEALKKLKEASDKLTTSFEEMIEALRTSIRGILDSIKPQIKDLQTIIKSTGSGTKPTSIDTINSIIDGVENPNFKYPPAITPYDPLSSLMATTADISSAGAYNPLSGLRPTAQDIQIYIDASNMIDSDRMVDVVQNAFLTIQRQGGSTVPAGAF